LPVDWERLKAGFNDALALAPELRGSFVARVCGAEIELRPELEALLRAHHSAGSFLSAPNVPLTGQSYTAPCEAPSHERFDIMRRIGEGGMAPSTWRSIATIRRRSH
jgi:hypothetical protein